MSSLNQVQIIGRLGKDPEVRYLPDGSAVTNVTVATSESWTDKQSGEKKEATEWHRGVIYGKLAEIAGQYLKKGGLVFLQGKLKTRKWQDQSGQDRYTTEINVSEMKMLGKKEESGDSGFEQHAPQQQRRPAAGGQRAPAPTSVADMDDDIPFCQIPARYDV